MSSPSSFLRGLRVLKVMPSTKLMSSQAPSPKIAIVGGGPAGLTLARLLEVKGLDYVVYERDESESSNPAGGSLDIHPQTGQRALREAGLLQEFLKHARYDDTKVSLADKYGKELLQVGSEGTSPEINRTALRQLLLDAVPKDKIQWGHVLKGATMSEDDKPLLHFTNGAMASGFDLVVGADGAWSKVRSLVTQAKPRYTGKTYIESRLGQENAYYPELAKRVGAGLFMAIGDGTPIVVQRQGDRSYRMYFGLQVSDDYFRNGTIDLRNIEDTQQLLLTRFYTSWGEEYKSLIRNADNFRLWTLYTLSTEDIGWEPVRGVTLIGDAAHVAYPGGSGVNLAMLDALSLVSSIVDHGSDNLEQAIRKYETAMFSRGIKAVTEGNEMARLMFDQDPQVFYEVLRGAADI